MKLVHQLLINTKYLYADFWKTEVEEDNIAFLNTSILPVNSNPITQAFILHNDVSRR